MEEDEITKVELTKQDVTFVWVKAEVCNKNLIDDYDWIETYVDVPYFSKYFNSLKTEQKKAICQVRLLDKGIITNYDSILIGEKSELDDEPNENYMLVKDQKDITPDSPWEEIAAALVKKKENEKAIELCKKSGINESDVELDAIVGILCSHEFWSLPVDYHSSKQLIEKSKMKFEEYCNRLVNFSRQDSYYANKLLEVCKACPIEASSTLVAILKKVIEIYNTNEEISSSAREQLSDIFCNYISAYLTNKTPSTYSYTELFYSIQRYIENSGDTFIDIRNRFDSEYIDAVIEKLNNIDGDYPILNDLMWNLSETNKQTLIDKTNTKFTSQLSDCEELIKNNEKLNEGQIHLLNIAWKYFVNLRDRIDILFKEQKKLCEQDSNDYIFDDDEDEDEDNYFLSDDDTDEDATDDKG